MSDFDAPTAADEIVEIFMKATRKSAKKLRKAGFENYYDQNRAEETHAHLSAAVAGTIAFLLTGINPLCEDCDVCPEDDCDLNPNVSVTVEDDVPEFEVWNMLPEVDNVVPLRAPIVINVNEAVSPRAVAEEISYLEDPTLSPSQVQEARLTADRFNLMIRQMLDETATPNAAKFLSSVDLAFNGNVDTAPETEKPYDPKGWPLDTPVNEMTEGEQLLWWKHQSRKNEARAKKYYAEANQLRAQIDEARRAYERRTMQVAWDQRLQPIQVHPSLMGPSLGLWRPIR